MLAARGLRLSSRVVMSPVRASSAAARCVSSTSSVGTPTDEDNNILQQGAALAHLRLNHSIEPIPYTSGIELTPVNSADDKLGHKKVTVVGCGQVSTTR
jgi:hypothetical protein